MLAVIFIHTFITNIIFIFTVQAGTRANPDDGMGTGVLGADSTFHLIMLCSFHSGQEYVTITLHRETSLFPNMGLDVPSSECMFAFGMCGRSLTEM